MQNNKMRMLHSEKTQGKSIYMKIFDIVHSVYSNDKMQIEISETDSDLNIKIKV